MIALNHISICFKYVQQILNKCLSNILYRIRVMFFFSAGQHLMLSLYRNHILHVFVRPAMIAVSVNSCSQEKLSTGQYTPRIPDLGPKWVRLALNGTNTLGPNLSLKTLVHHQHCLLLSKCS